MNTTIDKAGRIVVPKAVREKLRFYPGSALELEPVGDELRLRLPRPEATFVEKDGVLVHHGGKSMDLDLVAFIERQREDRAMMGSIEERPQ